MKRNLPYIIAVVIILVLVVVIGISKRNAPRKINERITLQQKDKIPYGTSVAKTLLPSLFPGSSISYDNRPPGSWDSLTPTSYNQAVILVALDFDADVNELNWLQYFAQQGNYVFIIARSFSHDATRFFDFAYSGQDYETYMSHSEDSLSIKLEKPSFPSDMLFAYPGKKFASTFFSLDTAHCRVLGRDEKNAPNFLEYRTGNGRIFIHAAPLAFSNYFILHKNNIGYFQDALSVIPKTVERIAWNEYYINRPSAESERNDEPNWYRVLFRYDAFKWGLLTGLFSLLLFALLGSRRRQRMIPSYQKPQNDSLDFVKTLGRLYHDRRDHQNLAKKMSVYFLEHVRSSFKLPTHTLDDNFVKALHFKTGYPEEDLSRIFSFINYLNENGAVNELQLSEFHRQLEKFYQTT
ncbi:MAG: hypothetical protein ACJ749_15515 [Flavisolibacter sp.]